jgi:hypothetical protein
MTSALSTAGLDRLHQAIRPNPPTAGGLAEFQRLAAARSPGRG